MTRTPAGSGVGRALRLRVQVLQQSPVVRQFGGLTGGRGVAAVVSFVWLALAARNLSIDDFADLALILSVGAMTSVIADWGLVLVLNEAVAAEPGKARSSFTLVVRRRLLLVAPAAVAMSVLYLVAANDPSPLVPALYALSMVATVWYTSAAAALRGLGRVGPDAMNEVVSRLFVLVVGVFAVTHGASLIVVVGIYALADCLSAVALTIQAWVVLSPAEPADRSRFDLRRVGPLGVASLTGLLYYRIDVWLLAILAVAGDVADYSVCYRLLDGVVIPAGALAVVMVASTAQLEHGSARRKADRMAASLCVMMVPFVVLLLAFPGQFLRVAFGPAYVGAAPVLRILALAILPTVAGLVWLPLMSLRGKGLLPITMGSLVVNLGLNLLLIPHIGAEGAAVATVIGQVLLALLVRASLWRLPAVTAETNPTALASQEP